MIIFADVSINPAVMISSKKIVRQPLITSKPFPFMKRSTIFIALFALIAFAASAGEQTTAYSAKPIPIVKQVVTSQNRAKMLPSQKTLSQKRAPSANQFEGMTMYVNLTNSDTWDGVSIGSVPYGIYSYTIGGSEYFKPLATDLRYNFMASAMGRDQLVGARPMQMMGVLNGVEYNGLSRDNYNELWSVVYSDVDYSFIPSVMAYDVTSDIIYSVQYNSDLTGLNMAKWNPERQMFETICPWPNNFQPLAMGFTPNGDMYCIGYDGEFYEVDKMTGDARSAGTLEVAPTLYVQGMGYEPVSGCFLWMAVTQQGSALYAIDPYDVSMTLVEPMEKNEQATTVFFEGNNAPAKAPAGIKDLAFTFDGANTEGQITFTVPTTTFDGSPLGDNVTMTVWLDGEPIANYVTVAPGSQHF